MAIVWIDPTNFNLLPTKILPGDAVKNIKFAARPHIDGSDSCREFGHRSPRPAVHPPLHGLVQEIQVFHQISNIIVYVCMKKYSGC